MKAVEAEEVTTTSTEWREKWLFWNLQAIGDGVSTYILRLEILRTPWFSIMLHRIFRPDQQRELHDHPWSFFSVVLRGFYVETVPCGECRQMKTTCPAPLRRRVHRWNWKRAEDSHSIREVSRSPVWTLVFTGAKRRLWGFYTRRGWVAWNDYEKLNEA